MMFGYGFRYNSKPKNSQTKVIIMKKIFNFKALGVLFFTILLSSVAFCQATKTQKQPGITHKGSITSEIQTAINNSVSSANPISVAVSGVQNGVQLYAVVANGQLVKFEAKDPNGKPMNTSIQRTSNQGSTSLICRVCILNPPGGDMTCWDVDCDLVLKTPEKKN